MAKTPAFIFLAMFLLSIASYSPPRFRITSYFQNINLAALSLSFYVFFHTTSKKHSIAKLWDARVGKV